MKPLTSTKGPPPKPIHDFAKYYLKTHGLEKTRNPELLANEFAHFYGLSGNQRLEELIETLKSKLGNLDIATDALSPDCRGSFGTLSDRIQIYIRQNDWDGSQEFTLGHELREILGVTFKDLDPDFIEADGEDLENEADAFSAALFMEPERFNSDMLHCGYDPIYLQKKYHKSYIGIVARMAAVSNLQKPKGHLWCSVFENENGLPSGYMTAKCFHRSPKYIPRERYRIPNFLFPKRGMNINLRESLLSAYESKLPVHIRRLSGLDFWDKYCLSVIIRPVIWGNEVAKLIVICMPEERSYLLEPQLRRISPVIIKESFQLI